MDTIGFLELSSIATGIEAADAMLKAAQVHMISAKPSCPGKYIILVSGEVAAVQAAVEAGEGVGKGSVLDSLVIPRVHPQLKAAINMAVPPDTETEAIGVLEYFCITGSILGADAAVKAADVTILDIRLGVGIGGKSYVILTGTVAAVNEAVAVGAANGIEKGMLVSKVVIAGPHSELIDNLF